MRAIAARRVIADDLQVSDLEMGNREWLSGSPMSLKGRLDQAEAESSWMPVAPSGRTGFGSEICIAPSPS